MNELLIRQEGYLGLVGLNRPKALNALTLDMVIGIERQLELWREDVSIQAVLFYGEGGRAFCAGGDVKQTWYDARAYRAGDLSFEDACRFFAHEYRLNGALFHYPKPTYSFMNGITMGGGYGIAGNCRTRIATEMTRFAMPETAIGFAPDVGSMWHFHRAHHGGGRYCAVSGQVLNGYDMVEFGLAETVMKTDHFDDLVKHLARNSSFDEFMINYQCDDRDLSEISFFIKNNLSSIKKQ